MALDLYRPFSRFSGLDPFGSLAEIQGEMNRLFDSFFGSPGRPGTPVPERAWTPRVDVYETKDELVLTADLPGVNEKEIEVSMVGDRLTIKGERKHEHEWKDENFHRLERAYGAFERQLTISIPVEAEKVRARYKDGVLKVHLPKIEEVKPRRVKVEVA